MASVLISGTSSGFGRKTALELAARGHRVFAGMRDISGRNAPIAAALAAVAVEMKGSIEVVELDVTIEATVVSAVQQVIDGSGKIDVVVNNAGIAAGGLIETFTPEDIHRIFDVNVVGVHRMLRAALPTMRTQKHGLVITVTSTLGREVCPFLGPYVATKFALEGLLEAARYELSAVGIDSVIVQPGTFPTTSIVSNLLAPGDPERAAGYPMLTPVMGKFFGGLGEYASSGHAPDPALVATSIADIVDAPAGTREPRVTVDPNGPGGASELNAVATRVQLNVLANLGLSDLLPAANGE